MEVLVCKAIWKCSSFDGRKTTNERRTTNEERTNWLVRIFVIGPNFRLIGPNSERLVRIRTIGPNSERLVRIPNDWSEFRTIGPNSEKLGWILNEWRVWRCYRVELADVVKFVKVSNGQKEIGVDWPRPSQFQKNLQRVKRRNWKIGVDRSRQSQKRPLQRQVSLKFLHDWSPGGRRKRFALRWPDLDKRCSSCYTLRGCVFADVQSREELKMLLQAKRQPG